MPYMVIITSLLVFDRSKLSDAPISRFLHRLDNAVNRTVCDGQCGGGLAEQTSRSGGFRRATLWVFEANNQARHFYGALGFRADRASKTLNPGAPLKAVRYGKELANSRPTAGAAAKDDTDQPPR